MKTISGPPAQFVSESPFKESAMLRKSCCVLAYLCTALSVTCAPAHAQTATEATLYTFCSQEDCSDGQNPSTLVQGIDGNLYGITPRGGMDDNGTFYKCTTAGNFTTLYSFCATVNCTDGYVPDALL